MKIGIIGGAGTIGSSIAFYLAVKNVASEIVLIDIKENIVKAHVMDMEQAISELNPTVITAGGFEALAGCDLVIVAASIVAEGSVQLRLESNLKLVQIFAAHIARYCPGAAVLTGTNPIDSFNYILYRLTGMPASRFVGYSRNDSLRLRWATGKLLKVPATDVQALVIGEHGPAMVPLFSTVTVKGKHVELSASQQAEIATYLKTWFATYEGLNSGRTAAWTSAVGVGRIVESMVGGSGELNACSAILDGQYGFSGISLGVPVILGRSGIEQIVELDLAPGERAGLAAAAQKTTDLLNSVPWQTS